MEFITRPYSRRTRTGIIAMIGILVLSLLGNAYPAQAIITAANILSSSCTAATVSVTYNGTLGTGRNNIRVYAYITAQGLPSGDLGQIFSPDFTAATPSGSFTISLTFTTPQPTGTNITLWISQFGYEPSLQEAEFARPNFNCTLPATPIPPTAPPPPPSYYNPGDGRIDPRPGDRIAVYCRADRLDVWGISNVGQGAFLASFNYTELIRANGGPVTRGANNYGGVVTATGRADGVLSAAWSGGFYGATGTGDFAKQFRCNLPGYIYVPVYPPYYPYYPPNPYKPPYKPPKIRYVYYVRYGDTLYKIARRFGVTLSRLLAVNPHITSPNRIYVGMRVYIP